MDVTLHVTSNLAKENDYAQVLHDARTIAAHIGAQSAVWRVQECETWGHVRALELVAAGHGLSIFWPGGRPKRGAKPRWSNYCPILFTVAHHTLVSGGRNRSILGRRKQYPTEALAHVILDRHTGGRVIGQAHASVHMIPQAFTRHPERRGRWRRQMARVAKVTRILAAKRPTIGGADFNRDRARVPGSRPVFTAHGTDGGAHYDGFWLAGDVGRVLHKYRIPLRSDHDAAFALIED